MKDLIKKIHLLEFEYRIFVSLTIVLSVYISTITIFRDDTPLALRIGNLIGLMPDRTIIYLYLILAILMAAVTLLRMWAGSILTSQTVMSFSVQTNILKIEGPYLLVRNPIYLADLLAMAGFALCLPTIGIMIPILFYLHYIRLIKFEEISFLQNFKEIYEDYIKSVPRLIPTPQSLLKFLKSRKKLSLNKDGIRHNALYLLFVPGFIIAAVKGNFMFALCIGLPGVIDWAIVHTRIGLKKSKIKSARTVSGGGRDKKVFNDILYAQCWEDPYSDRLALRIQPDDIVFSITSGGCNVLAFLIDDPAKIIALDLNRSQNHLLALKIAAFKYLSYPQILQLFGIEDSKSRVKLYRMLRSSLEVSVADYWDRNQEKINKGILHCGRYEHYMHLLKRALEITMGRTLIHQFYQVENSSLRLELYHQKWDNIFWKIITKVLLSRGMMSLLFDKAFFAYLNDSFSFGNHFAKKVKRAFTELPFKENYFLRYILLGNHDSEFTLPYYLQPQYYEIIRERVDRIEQITDSCEHFFSTLPDDYISKFNFSNIFEWMSHTDFENLLRQTIRIAKNGAILTYRNLLVHRERPPALAQEIRSCKKIARQIHAQDLSFIYNNYVVEKIQKAKQKWLTKLEDRQTTNY